MSRVGVRGRVLFALWRHPRRIIFSRHASRPELVALLILFRELRLSAVDRLLGHTSSRTNGMPERVSSVLSGRTRGPAPLAGIRMSAQEPDKERLVPQHPEDSFIDGWMC